MKKGKSRTRKARADILRSNAANTRQKQRAAMIKAARKSYDKRAYDGNRSEEEA